MNWTCGVRRASVALAAGLLVCTGTAQAQSDRCAEGPWILDGAPAAPDDRSAAAFLPAWQPLLEEVAACVRKAPKSCVQVRGSYDEKPFSNEVVRAFGGPRAAQVARARGRSALVIDRLATLGVDPAQLRELPPAGAPAHRGVVVTLAAQCLPEEPTLSEADRRAIEEAKAVLKARQVPPAPAEEVAPAARAASPWFVEAGVFGGFTATDPADAFAPGLRLGLGARSELLYARVNLGGSVSGRAEQRMGWELLGAVGVRPLSWLDLGVGAGFRAGGPEVVDPWVERSWYVGLDAAQRLIRWEGGLELVLQEGIHPIGRQSSWAELTDAGTLRRVDVAREPLLRIDVGLALRQQL